MIIEGNHIYAEGDKYLRRILDKIVVGRSYALGYIYYLDGKKLPEPKLEVPGDFEEASDEEIKEERDVRYPNVVEKYIREKYTVSDELAIQRQRDTKPEAFAEYFDYCESCKARAKSEVYVDYDIK